MNGIMQINVTKRPHDNSTVNDDSEETNDIIDEVRIVRKLLLAANLRKVMTFTRKVGNLLKNIIKKNLQEKSTFFVMVLSHING